MDLAKRDPEHLRLHKLPLLLSKRYYQLAGGTWSKSIVYSLDICSCSCWVAWNDCENYSHLGMVETIKIVRLVRSFTRARTKMKHIRLQGLWGGGPKLCPRDWNMYARVDGKPDHFGEPMLWDQRGFKSGGKHDESVGFYLPKESLLTIK